MIENEFIVPDRIEDLCEIKEEQYVVNDVCSIRDLSTEIKMFKDLLQEEGDVFIFKHFDTFYSMLRQFSETEENICFEACEILLEVAQNLINEVPAILESNEEYGNSEFRFKYRNLIKMTVYLLCQLAESYETELLKPTIIVSEKKKGRKKKKVISDSGWGTLRNDFVTRVSELYRFPISRLWEPPIIEHEFVNIVTLSFFKLLENPEVVQSQELCDDIFDFLGFSLKAHDTDLGYSIKIIQLVQDYQHLPSCLPKLIHLFINQYGKKSIVIEIFREIGCLDSDDLTRDTVRTHNLCNFLIGIAEKSTNDVMKCIDILLPNLEEESHILRNCIVTIIGEVVNKISGAEEFSQDTSDLRDRLISILLDHMLDMNAFVRCKVLQVAKHLVSEGAMPLITQLKFLDAAIERLEDKTCAVRKYALQFLKAFLMSNPFVAQLPIEELKASYERETAKLREMMPEIKKSSVVEFDSDEEDEEMDAIDERKLNGTINAEDEENPNGDCGEHDGKASPDGDGKNNDVRDDRDDSEDDRTDSKDNQNGAKGNQNGDEKCATPTKSEQTAEPNAASTISEDDKAKQLILVEYLKLTLQSAKSIIDAMPWICELMKSMTVTDVLESIDYMSVAFELGLREAVTGIKEMMRLIFSREPSVKNAVVASYKKLYLTTKEGEDKNIAATLISKNLIMFLHGATENEVLAIEHFIREFIRTGDINNLIIEKLWQTFTMASEETTEEESHSSLLLLSMAASEDPNIIMRKLGVLTRTGLGVRGENDFWLVKETCKILLKLDIVPKPKDKSKKKPSRLPPNHRLFLNLTILLIHGVINEDDDCWCAMAEQILAVIFKFSDHPENLCKLVIQQILKKVYNESEDVETTTETYDKHMVFVRFLFLIGHVALCYVIYLENDVVMEIRRREQQKMLKAIASGKMPFDQSTKNPLTAEKENEASGSECQGAETEDVIVEFITRVCNEEILKENHCFGVLFNAILFTIKYVMKHDDSQICAAATLSLAKFMTINPKTCEENMQLLITLLEKSPGPNVRSNIIIAMGDLLVRFPNEVQPWTPNLYGRLKDEDQSVRLNTMVVLSHLILHDMVKVKGQISDIALCMINDTEEIATVVRYLFKELSKKKNTLYNLLPDLISGLSDTSTTVAEEHFQAIVSFVFQFIEKEREVEGLVEKLCTRIKDISTPEQLHKIMYSLNLFTMNEKSFRKVMEYKDYFKGKSDDAIFVNYMKEITTNAKKNIAKLEQEITAFEGELSLD